MDDKSEREPYFCLFEDPESNTAAILVVDETPIEGAVARLSLSTRSGIVDLDLSERNVKHLIEAFQIRLSPEASEEAPEEAPAPADIPTP